MDQNSLPSLHWLDVQTDRIFLQPDIRMHMVRARGITFIKAEGNYPMFTWELTPPCSSGAEWQTPLPALRFHR